MILHKRQLPDSRKARVRKVQRKLRLMVVELHQHWLCLPTVSCFVCLLFLACWSKTLYWTSNHQAVIFTISSFFPHAFFCLTSTANSARSLMLYKEMMLTALERGSFHSVFFYPEKKSLKQKSCYESLYCRLSS